MQLAFVLVAGYFVVELVAGLLSGSLALLSDAGHMAADVVALGAAWWRLASPRGRTARDVERSVRTVLRCSHLGWPCC